MLDNMNKSGITIMELAIIVGIVGLFSSIGIPSFRALMSYARHRSLAGTLEGDFSRARNMAMMMENQDEDGKSIFYGIYLPDQNSYYIARWTVSTDDILSDIIPENVDVSQDISEKYGAVFVVDQENSVPIPGGLIYNFKGQLGLVVGSGIERPMPCDHISVAFDDEEPLAVEISPITGMIKCDF